MNRMATIIVCVVLWTGLHLNAQAQQNSLPEDVRQVLPSARMPAASRPTPAPEVPSPQGNQAEETSEQLLERAILRYRNILDQGANSSWEADVAQRVEHLEAVLKKLKEDAATKPTSQIPAATNGPKTAPRRVPSPVVPASAAEPVPAAPASPPLPAPPVPTPQPKVAPRPLERPTEAGPSVAETAEQLEEMAAACQRLAQDLRVAASQLRDSSRVQKGHPALTSNR